MTVHKLTNKQTTRKGCVCLCILGAPDALTSVRLHGFVEVFPATEKMNIASLCILWFLDEVRPTPEQPIYKHDENAHIRTRN